MGRRILIVSVHPVLEYDEIRLFESLGCDVFSLGYYLNRGQELQLRPGLPSTEWHAENRKIFSASGCRQERNSRHGWVITDAFCKNFDIVVVHHNYEFINCNWEAIRSRHVVWRTIGQALHHAEHAMREHRVDVKIVRWSPEEARMRDFIGADAYIRACKDPADWGGWNGRERRVITFNNNFQARGDGMNFAFHQQCVEGYPFDLYGLRNDGIPNWRGTATYSEQQDILRRSRAAFVTGTWPAPYTLGFIEAWMTGIPVVHVGRRRFEKDTPGTYEIDNLIVDGESGFLVDEVEQARSAFARLLEDEAECQRISTNGRAAACKYFGIERAKVEWMKFFNDNGM